MVCPSCGHVYNIKAGIPNMVGTSFTYFEIRMAILTVLFRFHSFSPNMRSDVSILVAACFVVYPKSGLSERALSPVVVDSQ